MAPDVWPGAIRGDQGRPHDEQAGTAAGDRQPQPPGHSLEPAPRALGGRLFQEPRPGGRLRQRHTFQHVVQPRVALGGGLGGRRSTQRFGHRQGLLSSPETEPLSDNRRGLAEAALDGRPVEVRRRVGQRRGGRRQRFRPARAARRSPRALGSRGLRPGAGDGQRRNAASSPSGRRRPRHRRAVAAVDRRRRMACQPVGQRLRPPRRPTDSGRAASWPSSSCRSSTRSAGTSGRSMRMFGGGCF